MKINLKELRQTHKLSQGEMAQILELNQSNVSRAEIKGYLALTPQQRKALYDRFGKETVDSFELEKNISVVATGNTNHGEGTQNNGYFGIDTSTLDIIRKQSEALTMLAEKQAEQTDKLIALLEKISEKL